MLLAGIIGDISEKLSDFSSHWWFLGIIFAIAFLDSVIPIVPSETCVIIGGVAAGAGNQILPLVIVAGAIGAWLGDNTAYLIGARASNFFQRRAERKEKFRKRLEWATEQMRERGGLLLITARFIPGGRTALTLASGITRQPRPWFMRWTAIAAVIWATYASVLGYIGGKTFKDNHTVAFLVAFGLALGINVIIELVRHFRKKKTAVAA